jgi:hypothetical protein
MHQSPLLVVPNTSVAHDALVALLSSFLKIFADKLEAE